MRTRNYSDGKPGVELATGIHQICWSNFSGAMRSRSVGTKKSVYLLLEIRSRQLAYLVQLLQYSHEPLSLCIGLRIQWRLSLMTKAQVLAEVTEVLAIEQRSIVTAYRHWYAQRGKGFIHLWYHCPGAGGGDKFYFRPSGLLAHRNQQILSGMDGAPAVYSNIFPRLTGHGCHA